MALDDFDDFEPTPGFELEPEGSLAANGGELDGETAQAAQAPTSEDDDLFDLRTLDDIELLLVSEEASPDEPSLAAQAVDEVVGTEAPTAVAEREPAEIDLDEDLFDFGSPGDEHLDRLVSLGSDLAEILSEVGETTIPRVKPKPAPVDLDCDDLETGTGGEPRADRGAPTDRSALPAPATAAATGVNPRPVRPQPSWIAIASVLAANFILLFFAWSASRSLHAHLTVVRDEIRQQPAIALASAPEPVAANALPTTAGSSPVDGPEHDEVADSAAQSRRPVVLPRLPSEEALALRVAEEEIADERFGAARRRLYRLLAQADGLPPETRATVEARALYLIGDTYARQAALGEGRP